MTVDHLISFSVDRESLVLEVKGITSRNENNGDKYLYICFALALTCTTVYFSRLREEGEGPAMTDWELITRTLIDSRFNFCFLV